MSNNTEPRGEALIVHKHGLNATAPYMAMPIVPVDRFRQSAAPKAGCRTLRTRLRAMLARVAK